MRKGNRNEDQGISAGSPWAGGLKGREMRKYLLATAALVAALAVSAVSGAGTAGASTGTGTRLCAGTTCVYQSDFRNYPLTIPYTDGTVKYVLKVTIAQELCVPGKCYWTSAYFAPNGLYGTPGDVTTPVTSITLPVTYNPSGYFTCLYFSYPKPPYNVFLLSSPASPGTWVQNNINNCAPGKGITP